MSEKEKLELQISEEVDSLLPKEMPKAWNVSDKGLEAIKLASMMHRTKHGLYASIPIICKAEECPYADTCPLLQIDMAPKGERCPIEIASILKKYEEYTHEFGVDENNIVDMSLIKDLVDLDIQIARADNKMAIDGDFIQDQVVGISESTGEAITTPNIHKAVDYKDKLLKKRHDILQLMHSTRKDKAGDKLTVTLDPSTYASQIMQEMQRARKSVNPILHMEQGDE